MHLKEYRKQAGISQAKFGAGMIPPVSGNLVSQWEDGRTRVTLSYALQIRAKTRGRVSAQDCLDMFGAQAGEAP